MARQSAASLSVVPVQPIGRIEPPKGLTPEELTLWRAVVDSKPADWFGEDSAPLLTEYVRAVHMCDRLREQIEVAIAEGEVPEKLMRLRDMEAKRATSLATKLRMTQQSRYTPQAAATANKKAGNARPWETR